MENQKSYYKAVTWVCLQFVIVVFHDHTHLLVFLSACIAQSVEMSPAEDTIKVIFSYISLVYRVYNIF